MAKYIVTAAAGRYVAGYRNPSEGAEVELTEEEAHYELILGTVVRAPVDPVVAEEPAAAAEAENPKKPGKKKR